LTTREVSSGGFEEKVKAFAEDIKKTI